MKFDYLYKHQIMYQLLPNSRAVKRFNLAVNRDIQTSINQHSNHLWTLIKLFPDAKWDWQLVMVNRNTTWDIVQTKWSYEWVSANPNLKWQTVLDLAHMPWNWRDISANPNISWNDIKNNLDLPKLHNAETDWDWNELSLKADWQYIANHLDLPWNFAYLSRSKHVTWDIIKANSSLSWYWPHVCVNPNITFEIAINHINDKINWSYLSYNININISIVATNLDLPWDMSIIKQNPTILKEYIEYKFKSGKHKHHRLLDSLDTSLYIYYVTDSNMIDINHIKMSLSNSPAITWKVIYDNKDLPWMFDDLSANEFQLTTFV
jgi:hypothetical protein